MASKSTCTERTLKVVSKQRSTGGAILGNTHSLPDFELTLSQSWNCGSKLHFGGHFQGDPECSTMARNLLVSITQAMYGA